MKTNRTTIQSTIIALVAVNTLLWAGATQAASITMTASDSSTEQSFTSNTHWSSGAAPTAGNTYSTEGFILRTLNSSITNFTFAGDSLTINLGNLTVKSVPTLPTNGIITVNDLRLAGGTLNAGNAVDQWFAGNITLTATSTISANAVGTYFDIRATIAGVTGNDLTIGGSGGAVQFGTVAKTYSGNTIVNSGAVLRMGLANAMPFGSGKGDLTVTGTFRLNGFATSINGLSGAGIVENASATARTLTVGNDNDTTSFTGTIQNGTSAGSLALTKTGTGILTLSGAGNTYTGLTTVSEGRTCDRSRQHRQYRHRRRHRQQRRNTPIQYDSVL